MFKRIKYLLMHGTGDGKHHALISITQIVDNVHFMNSALFVDKLTEQNVEFEFMVISHSNINAHAFADVS